MPEPVVITWSGSVDVHRRGEGVVVRSPAVAAVAILWVAGALEGTQCASRGGCKRGPELHPVGQHACRPAGWRSNNRGVVGSGGGFRSKREGGGSRRARVWTRGLPVGARGADALSVAMLDPVGQHACRPAGPNIIVLHVLGLSHVWEGALQRASVLGARLGTRAPHACARGAVALQSLSL